MKDDLLPRNIIKVNDLYNQHLDNEQHNYQNDKLGSKIKVFFNYNQILGFELFKKLIFDHINININYMLLVKIRYQGTRYLTINNQESSVTCRTQ